MSEIALLEQAKAANEDEIAGENKATLQAKGVGEFDPAGMNEIEKEQSERFTQLTAKTYDWWRQRKHCKIMDELYLAHLKGESFLEVGCGAGHLMAKFRERFPDGRFAGIDIAPGMVTRAREMGFEEVYLGSGNDLSRFGDESFDVVTAGTWVVRYLDRERAFREMWRVLRPGGRVAFDLPFVWGHGMYCLSQFKRVPRRWWKPIIEDAHLQHDGRWVYSWKRALSRAGFRVLDVAGAMDAPFYRKRFGLDQLQRGGLGLLLSFGVWFLGEKPRARREELL